MRKILKISTCIFLLAAVLFNARIGFSQEACSNNLLSPQLSLQQEHLLRIFSADKISVSKRTTVVSRTLRNSKTAYFPPDYNLKINKILVQVNYWGTMEYVMDEIHPKLPENIAMVIIFNERLKPYLDYAKTKLSSRKVEFISSGKISIWARDNYIYSFSNDKPIMVLPDGELYRNIIEKTTDKAMILKLAGKLKMKIIQAKFHFTAGDIMTSEEHIFVGEVTIKENVKRFKITREETIRRMEVFFDLPVEVLDLNMTTLHNDIDSVLTFLPGKRVVLGNNACFDSFLQTGYQEKLAGIKQRLLELKYEIIEIPWRAHEKFETETDVMLISYNNVVFLDRHTILLPQNGIPEDNEAISIWEKLGYKVIPIQTFCNGEHGGSIRCFTNIINADLVDYDSEDSFSMSFLPAFFHKTEQLVEMAI